MVESGIALVALGRFYPKILAILAVLLLSGVQ